MLRSKVWIGFDEKVEGAGDNFVILTRFGVILPLFVKVLLTIPKVIERR